MAKHYFFGEPIENMYQRKYHEHMNEHNVKGYDYDTEINYNVPSLNIETNLKEVVNEIKDEILSSINNKEISININLNLDKDKPVPASFIDWK